MTEAASDSDEDQPVAQLNQADGPPPTSAVVDSDSDDDILGGARGRLAHKGGAAAAADDDLDDLLDEELEVAPGPLKARRLLKGGSKTAAPKELVKPPKHKKERSRS